MKLDILARDGVPRKTQKTGGRLAGHRFLPLRPGLKDGTLVTLLSFDHGYWTVEACGEPYSELP